MQKIKLLISDELKKQIDAVNPDTGLAAADISLMLEYPPDRTLGDLALPCFKLSKLLRRSPVQIAQAMSEGFACPAVSECKAVNGYLNIFISDDYLASSVISEILTAGNDYGKSDIGKGKTVVLDYSSPNVAKPFHIGHLGTTVIGHSIKRLHEFAGYNCVGVNHLGDWGTQFGKLIVAFKKWGDREVIENGGIDELVKLYVQINNAISGNEELGIPADPALGDEARAEFVKIEQGDEENMALWRWFLEISIAEYQKTYAQLDITFDSYKGESFYILNDKLTPQVERLRERGLLKVDDGATIVDLSEYNMPPCIIFKSDGSTIYHTRDIAAAAYRHETYDFEKCIYVTSSGQCLHFAQLFKVLDLMGYEWHDKMVHVPYGTVSINGAKLATRTGNVVLLKDLFATAIEKVSEIMEEKNPALKGRTDIAEAVGVGAIVFHYLSNSRIKDMNFNMEDALDFNGNTGPYVQYTYARCCSILEKAGETPASGTPLKLTAATESALVKTLSRFPEKVNDAIAQYEPSVITRYILDVAADFNRFYHDCQILSATDPEVRATRIMLTEAAKTVLGNAFSLICLKKTEKI